MFDVKAVQDEARKELMEERATAAKKKIKDKLRQLEDAKKVVRNIERELEEINIEIGE